MSIKSRLSVLSFFQFFVWGAWLITIGVYWFQHKGWSGSSFGAVFSTLGLGSIIMPAIVGMVADKWMRSERLLGILHLLYGVVLILLYWVDSPSTFFYVMLLAMLFYMPTISLFNSTSYTILKQNDFDVVKVFPPIRVWGTIGFVAAMWLTNLTGNKDSPMQFVIAGAFAVLLGVYCFTLPACMPPKKVAASSKWTQLLGLDAFKLFADRNMAVFFIFSGLLGAALQLANMYGDAFLSDFEKVQAFQNSFVVKYSTIIMSISQISETVFILAITFFLTKFGIKKVMLMSMLAWFLRFILLAYGDPGAGLWMILLSNIIYGMAFDFFNISGSLYVESSTESHNRSSAQGLFMMMNNGVGAMLGSYVSGWMIQEYFIDAAGNKMWQEIWTTFALYALFVGVAFAILFRYKHTAASAANT